MRTQDEIVARVRHLDKVNDALKQLVTYDREVDGKAGSPNPGMTALVRMVAYCMTFARSAIAHGIVDADFEEVLKLAREHEEDGWKAHREQCGKCGSH